MSTPQPHLEPRSRGRLSANERLKQQWSTWMSASLLAAVAVHLGVFLLWPEMEVQGVRSVRGKAAHVVSLGSAPQVDMPAPPEAVPAPARPVVTAPELEPQLAEEMHVAMPSFEEPLFDNLAELLIPPPTQDQWLDYEQFAPFLVYPRIRNEREVKRFLERHYTPILSFSGATGVVQVFFWIDEQGSVARAEIAESSGSRALDRLAMRLSAILRFSPAMRAGRPVRVQVRLPITFRQT